MAPKEKKSAQVVAEKPSASSAASQSADGDLERRTSDRRSASAGPGKNMLHFPSGAAKGSGREGASSAASRPAPNNGARSEPRPPFREKKQERPGLESKMKHRPRYKGPEYRGSGKLQDKVAIITGGDSGIGRAVAVLFAREGANISIIYLPQEHEDAQETRNAVEAEGRQICLIPGDVSDPAFCRNAVQHTVRRFGKLDILVNNAAYQQHQETLDDITEEQWDRTFRTNIYGYFFMVKSALPHLKAGSAIVNTGSITGLEGNKQLMDYAATKGAINAFTKSLAQNLVERRIRVNCVAPGPVWTPLNVADKDPRESARHGEDTPMKRPAQPEEIAPAFVFFASECDSSYITGEVLTLLGGDTIAA